ncbi:XRE family transcriptional regulator [Staphylococcus sp. HMSC057C08]|uniref:hypothetical protein n=1 Tax=Staphylococcus TaxID=1279 RepID=UPI0008C80083|nr:MULTISPECIES: hypothetical protein [Staphylococcus]OFP25041.1 XRE family transcriptional regulator [Staphylococcus sp. HMSC057C08]RIN43548.1 hypothetical protein BU049_12175 [Staphylococcus simulans]RIN68815.1 hypothetical protein BU017_10435 [Staphylococcus simulans]
MNSYDELLKTVNELIENKEISSYRINKDTGVSYGNINDIRRGERKVENLTLKNAGKLYNYAKIHLK